MASNYSSYSTPYSSQYYTAPYLSYPIKPPHSVNVPNDSIKTRSQSYNDLSATLNQHQTSPYYYMPRSPSMSAFTSMINSTPQLNYGKQRANTATHANNNANTSRVGIQKPQGPPPATLSRYRGRHIRAHSASSLVDGPQSTQSNLHKKPAYNASISSSDISLDSESLRTQTSTSSSGSIHSGLSWPEEEAKNVLKQTRNRSPPPKFVQVQDVNGSKPNLPLAEGSVDKSSNTGKPPASQTSHTNNATSANVGAPIRRNCATPPPDDAFGSQKRNVNSDPSENSKQDLVNPSIRPVTPPNKTGECDSDSSDKTILPKSRAAQSPVTSATPSALVLPSDLRPRSYCLPSAQSPESSPQSNSQRPSLTIKTPGTPPLSIKNEFTDMQDKPDLRNNMNQTFGSRGSLVDDRSQTPSPIAPAPAKKLPNFSERTHKNTSSRQSVSSIPPAQRHVGPTPVSSVSHSRSMSEVSMPQHQTKPSRSFGSKLRGMFSSKSKSSDSSKGHSEAAVDNSDAQSIMSSKSSFSIKSTRSMVSFSNKFRRKKDTTNSAPDFTQPASTGRTRNINHNRSKSDAGYASSTEFVSQGHNSGPGMIKPSTNNSGRTTTPDFPRSSIDSSASAPRPPSPALRSAIPTFENSASATPEAESIETEQRKLDQPLHPEVAPSNLSAGDIFPGNLEFDNVETIVSSVQRTGSFKRQPSTSRRTEEEVVPNPQEIEVEDPKEVNTTPKLQSAMKSRQGAARRRSGVSKSPSVSFASQILVYKTYSSYAYDRTPDRMTCDLLSKPGVAQRLREELNQWKLLMQIHPDSMSNTQYFQV